MTPKKKRLMVFLGIFTAAAIWTVWSAGWQPSGETSSAAQSGYLAPDFTLSDSSGESVTLSELRGKPVILNLWASWCGPCRAEMPALQALHEDLGDQLVILGVNASDQDSRQKALSFLSENGVTFRIVFDERGEVSDLYLLQALPTTYFIRADGIIEDVIIGGPLSEALLRAKAASLLEGR